MAIKKSGPRSGVLLTAGPCVGVGGPGSDRRDGKQGHRGKNP